MHLLNVQGPQKFLELAIARPDVRQITMNTARRGNETGWPPGGPYPPLFFRPWLVVTPKSFIPLPL
jgi:hypothetical protein